MTKTGKMIKTYPQFKINSSPFFIEKIFLDTYRVIVTLNINKPLKPTIKINIKQ